MSDEERHIKVESIDFNKFNPNQMTPEKYAALKASIKQDGIQQPVLLRKKGDRFEMIDGENRTRIAKELKFLTVKSIIKEIDDQEAMRLCYKVNSDRGTIDAFKEALFFDLLAQTGLEEKATAKEYGVSEQFIKNRKKLLSINTEEKELLLKKVAKGTELSGAHWLAYAKAKPEARIELCKNIGRQGKLSVRDLEWQAKQAADELKRIKEFENALERTEFKNCPTCKGKATGLDYQKHLQCKEGHDWNPKTGKTSQQLIKATYTKSDKKKAPKLARNVHIEIDWKRAIDIAQKMVLKNLDKIQSITFLDRKGKEWIYKMDRAKGFEQITVQHDRGHEYDLSMRDPAGKGKRTPYVRGPQYAEIGKAEHKEMIALVKTFKGKVTDKRLMKKGAKK